MSVIGTTADNKLAVWVQNKNDTRRKKPKTKSEELTHPRLSQITRAGLITRAGMVIRPSVPRRDVDIEYLQVSVAAQEGSSQVLQKTTDPRLRPSLITRAKLPSPQREDIDLEYLQLPVLAVATQKDQAPVAVVHVQQHQQLHQVMNGVNGLLY